MARTDAAYHPRRQACGKGNSMTEENRFQVTYHGDVPVIHLETSTPGTVSCEWADPLMEFVEQHKPRRIVVDFETVTRFSAAAIGALIRVEKRVRDYSGRIRLSGMHPDVREVFKITRLDGSVFKILDSYPLARASFDSRRHKTTKRVSRLSERCNPRSGTADQPMEDDYVAPSPGEDHAATDQLDVEFRRAGVYHQH